MKARKVPLRMCVACRQMKPKQELIRIVRSQAGEINVDATGKAPGRGAYLCGSTECLERAHKTKALGRALEAQIDQPVWERLAEGIGEQ